MTDEPCSICVRRFGIGECNECINFDRFKPDAFVQSLIDAAKVVVRDELQIGADRAFNQGVKAGLRLAIQEAEAHKCESPLTLRMKIRALLEAK